MEKTVLRSYVNLESGDLIYCEYSGCPDHNGWRIVIGKDTCSITSKEDESWSSINYDLSHTTKIIKYSDIEPSGLALVLHTRNFEICYKEHGYKIIERKEKKASLDAIVTAAENGGIKTICGGKIYVYRNGWYECETE